MIGRRRERPTMHVLRRTLVPLLLLWIALGAAMGCENGSPPAGDECTTAGGICSNVACGASLPYPCPQGQWCCQPPQDAGARRD